MENLQIFKNEEFGQVRTVNIKGEPWFCLADICKALEIKNPSDMKKRLIPKGIDTTDTLTAKGIQNLLYINEPNLYKTIFQSRKESAERFTDWVTSEVLPAIRKSGRYGQSAYRIQDAPIGEVTALLHEASSFLREMDRVMRSQNSHPSDIAEEFKSVCTQLGIVRLSDNFVKEPYAQDVGFLPLEELVGYGD
ncbi:MAG: hypothetical protein HFH40_00560 [Lachnospiraceae bacterium]|nr:hypothetical protein [Lachnospiraceae bacterium]